MKEIVEVLALVFLAFGGLKLLSLPFTNHARTAHFGQYDARRICEAHDNGAPHKHYRRGATSEVVVDINDHVSGFVVIGEKDPAQRVIVTGFAMPKKRMEKHLRHSVEIEDL